MKILLVGGTFDEVGKQSSVINIISSILAIDNECTCINGGTFDDLKNVYSSIQDTHFDVVFWMANVPNTYEKIRDIKKLDYKTLLVASKRNDNEKYCFEELIQRSLQQKANLTIEFSKIGDKRFNMRVFDPLGTVWSNSDNIEATVKAIVERLKFLTTITRQATVRCSQPSQEIKEINISTEQEFINLVKLHANTFSKYINTVRFVGNASIKPLENSRCIKGFPSMRSKNCIFVSQRNINKENIEQENFVKVFNNGDKLMYVGENKPSVDTPVQVRLYAELPNINYMLHSHCYVEGGIFTNKAVPCGAIEEVAEILSVIDDKNKSEYKINLLGHGSIVMGNNLDVFKNVAYYKRPMPELMR